MCGINDQQTQKKLLAEKALSFDRAMEIVIDVESATKGARDITSRTCDNAPLHVASDKTPPIHVVSDKTPPIHVVSDKTPPIHVVSDKTHPVANNVDIITPTNFRQFLFRHYS